MSTKTRNYAAEYLAASIAVNDRWILDHERADREIVRNEVARDAAAAGVELDHAALNAESLTELSD